MSIEVEFSEFAQLCDRLVQMEKNNDAFMKKCVNRLTAQLFAKVRKRTPEWNKEKTRSIVLHGEQTEHKYKLMPRNALDRVLTAEQIWAQYWAGHVGGTLRREWKMTKATRQGDDYVGLVSNSTEYALYVEEGHRQQPGRYVPALGVFLKNSWVPGRHMLRISEDEMRSEMTSILQDMLDHYLAEQMKGLFDVG